MPHINYISMIITNYSYNKCICNWQRNADNIHLTYYKLTPIFLLLDETPIDLRNGKISHKSLTRKIGNCVLDYLSKMLNTKIKSNNINIDTILYTPPYQLNDYEIWIDAVVPVSGDVFELMEKDIATIDRDMLRIPSSQISTCYDGCGLAYIDINYACSDDSIFKLSFDSTIVSMITMCKLSRKSNSVESYGYLTPTIGY